MYRRILVPLDGSKGAEKALPYAVDLARQDGSRLLLVRVCSPVLGSTAAYPVGSGPLPSEVALSRQYLWEYLTELRGQLESQGLEVTIHTPAGEAAATICLLARQEPCDLIVMTSHGRTGLSRFLIGSVAEKVMRHAPCPVFLVERRQPLGARP